MSSKAVLPAPPVGFVERGKSKISPEITIGWYDAAIKALKPGKYQVFIASEADRKAQATLTDDTLRKLWRDAGGHFHGPRVETGTMPEEQLFPLLRRLITGGKDAER